MSEIVISPVTTEIVIAPAPNEVVVSAAGARGATGATGATGRSAYQIWLDQGHVGTEADFLTWLGGTDDVIQTFEQSCLVTSNVGDPICASSPFALQPRTDSLIAVQVNGVDVPVVFGTKVGGFAYFSNDNGTTAALKSELVQGSTLHWIAGLYGLDPSDVVRVRYEVIV